MMEILTTIEQLILLYTIYFKIGMKGTFLQLKEVNEKRKSQRKTSIYKNTQKLM
jgi:hypothetical protein